MTVSDDLAGAARDVTSLRTHVQALQERFGETLDVQRLRDDVARVAADLNLLARAAGVVEPTSSGDKVYIPDGDYDPSFWADADDEGLGATGRAR